MQPLLVAAVLTLGVLTASIYAFAIVLAIKLRILLESDIHQTMIDRPWKVSVIVPCKGWYPGLKENLHSILEQDYSRYEVIFVTRAGDSSVPYIEGLAEISETPTKVLSIESHDYRSDKINNQLAGINAIDKDSEILVFFDSDGYALPNFLSNLVAPLYDRNNIVTTSYRWFLLGEPSIIGAITMMCDSFAFLLQSSPWFTLPWGGAMAMTVDFFKTLQVEKEWQGALYDDYVLGLLLRRAQMSVSFVPSALVANPPLVSFRAFFQAGKRHLFLLRVVFRKHWVFALVSVNLVIFYPFILLALISRLEWSIAPAVGVAIALSMPALCTVIMRSVVSSCEDLHSLVGHPRIRIPRRYLALAFAVPIIFFIQMLSSTFGKTVEWQNITYEVTAYNETRVIG
jgi:cellulose synthase/poly-beta-1,6-N-acetylglucosamine synthase-like glycosyltransferase